MKKIMLFIGAIIGLSVFSCSQNDETADVFIVEEPQDDDPTLHHVTADDARENVAKFLDEFWTSTRSSDQRPALSNVVAVRAGDVSGVIPRITSANKVVFYAVNLADNQGFVLASSDDRYAPVYAYVESGSYSADDEPTPGFEQFLQSLVLRVTDENDSSLLASHVASIEMHRSSLSPKLHTIWGCLAPYNSASYVPQVAPHSVAMAQIAGYYCKPDSYYFAGYLHAAIPWDSIMAESNYYGGKLVLPNTNSYSLSAFMCNFTPTEQNETMTNSLIALEAMEDMGFSTGGSGVLYTLTSSSVSDIQYYLDSDYLVYARGAVNNYASYQTTVGHGWVIDGYSNSMLHCNWGWDGNRNGYYLCTAFEPFTGNHYQYQLSYNYLYW